MTAEPTPPIDDTAPGMSRAAPETAAHDAPELGAESGVAAEAGAAASTEPAADPATDPLVPGDPAAPPPGAWMPPPVDGPPAAAAPPPGAWNPPPLEPPPPGAWFASAAAAAPPVAAAEPGRRRRLAGRARRIGAAVRPMMMIVLFAGGIVLGAVAFQVTRPAAPGSTPLEEIVTSDVAPPAVRDLVAALKSDDRIALQSILPPDPYNLLAGELAKRSFQTIDSVDLLATYTHNGSSATEIVIHGEDSTGTETAINLVVHEQGDAIISFR